MIEDAVIVADHSTLAYVNGVYSSIDAISTSSQSTADSKNTNTVDSSDTSTANTSAATTPPTGIETLPSSGIQQFSTPNLSNSEGGSHKKNAKAFVWPEYPPEYTLVPGIKYDFNHGLRLLVTDEWPDEDVFVTLTDTDTANVLFSGVVKRGSGIGSKKKYMIRYRIDARTKDGKHYYHEYNPKGKEVLIQLPYEGALGDTIAWYSFVERFKNETGAKVYAMVPQFIRPLIAPADGITFVNFEEAKDLRPYAVFYVGLYFKGDTDWQPYDFRLLGLDTTAGHILGVSDLTPKPPTIHLNGERTIPEPYVCIATQASGHAKHWCNPSGWREVCNYLRSCGYRVLCIDKEPEVGVDDVWHKIPNGCEDFTGPRPLMERAVMLRHADLFVGLSSGLSWLAWCTGVPTVLISGICMPFGEFPPTRHVQNKTTCHGCWNDTRYEFDHHDFMWCPKFKGTHGAYQCTKAITGHQVINAIKSIPGIRQPIGSKQNE